MREVTVVIPHYGDRAPTLALIAQLAAQGCSTHIQIIVVDDASPVPFPETEGVELVRRHLNGGFGSAVNSGVELARGEILLVLNSDLEVSPDFVEKMVDASVRFPGAVLSPRVVDQAGEYAWPGREFPRVRHQATEWLTPLARWRHTDTWHRAVGHDLRARYGDSRVDWVMGAAMLIPTSPFQSLGGFDERFYMNAEEVDLQRRLGKHGIYSVALASPVVVHAGGGSTPSVRRRTWLVESRFIYARKWGGERRLRSALTACSLANFGVNCLRRLRGSSVEPLVTLRAEMKLALSAARERSAS